MIRVQPEKIKVPIFPPEERTVTCNVFTVRRPNIETFSFNARIYDATKGGYLMDITDALTYLRIQSRHYNCMNYGECHLPEYLAHWRSKTVWKSEDLILKYSEYINPEARGRMEKLYWGVVHDALRVAHFSLIEEYGVKVRV